MTRKLHPCARTNAMLRREIQELLETNKALAARLGLNLKTISKWRSRATTSDARKGPRPVATVLSAREGTLIRKHTRHSAWGPNTDRRGNSLNCLRKEGQTLKSIHTLSKR
jgi:hypothetical protein